MGAEAVGHEDSEAYMRSTEEASIGTSSQPWIVDGRYMCESDDVMNLCTAFLMVSNLAVARVETRTSTVQRSVWGTQHCCLKTHCGPATPL